MNINDNHNNVMNNYDQVGVTDVSSFGVSVSIESFPQGEPARNWLGTYVLTYVDIDIESRFLILLLRLTNWEISLFSNSLSFDVVYNLLTVLHTHTGKKKAAPAEGENEPTLSKYASLYPFKSPVPSKPKTGEGNYCVSS